MPIPLIPLAAGILGLAGYLIIKGEHKKVFISYYSKSDSHYKNMIIAWAKNNKFKLQLDDLSTDIKIKSNDLTYLKKRMKEQIRKADYFIVFVGKETHKRDWVSWEIDQAKKLGKKIIAIKEKRTHKSPKTLLGSNAVWVFKFSEENIRKALDY